MNQGPKRGGGLFDEKNRGGKSRGTVPSNSLICKAMLSIDF
jgi:hypothetical protein